jgi:hypothetical protein
VPPPTPEEKSQHPVGQLAGVHWHPVMPTPVHSVPVAHWGPLLQEHLPFEAQLLPSLVAVQSTQAAPAGPQAVVVEAAHIPLVPPLQQPASQPAGSQSQCGLTRGPAVWQCRPGPHIAGSRPHTQLAPPSTLPMFGLHALARIGSHAKQT